MTWGMFAIGQLELGRGDTAAALFSRSYEPYVHPPFYMWTGETMTSDSKTTLDHEDVKTNKEANGGAKPSRKDKDRSM